MIGRIRQDLAFLGRRNLAARSAVPTAFPAVLALLTLLLMPGAVAFADKATPAKSSALSAVEYAPATAQSAARLALALPARLDYRAFTLEGPPRLVLDLPGIRAAEGLALPGATLGEAAPARGVRVATRGESLRLVVDLAGPVPYRVAWRSAARGGGKNSPAWLDVSLGSPLPGSAPEAVPVPVPVPVPVAEALAAASPPKNPEPPKNPVQSKNPESPKHPGPSKNHVPVGGRDLVVAIDAGHGGKDPGALGAHGTREKDVTLAVARRLAATIDAEPGLRAYLVRDGDYFIELRQRMARARKAGADLFVSIHADSAPNRAAAGSSVFILSTRGASSEAARWLADRENSADLAGGVQLDKVDPTVASVLMDLSQGDTITASDRAARRVLDELDRIGNIHKREVQSAGFMVLKSPDIPSMLVETAFISHPEEEERLGDPAHQQRLAEAIHDGLRAYFYANPPPGTRLSQLAAANRSAARIAATVR